MGPSRPQGGLLDDIVPALGPVDPDAVSIAMRIGRLGHVPGVVLHHLDFRVLVYLLGQSPGPYAGQLDTLAEACASDTTSVGGALHRLREAQLLVWDPADLCRSTEVCRYSVHVQRLAALLKTPALARTTPLRLGHRRKAHR